MLLTEETEVPQDASKKASALTVAILVHVVLAIIFALIVVIPKLKDEPEIVAAVVNNNSKDQPKMEKKTVMKQVKQTSAASAASPIAKMIRSNTTAQIAAPEVTKVSDGPLGLGEGDFGDGFGDGSGGGGMGSGAMFFGSKSTGKRFMFCLDHSASMSQAQIDLRNEETEKALKALPSSVQYQVVLFAGGNFFAEDGWSLPTGGGGNRYDVEGPDGERYTFYAKAGAGDFELDGPDSELPKSQWRQATKANIKETVDFMQASRKFFGTDWDLALKTAQLMDPPPDVIFFMADGTGGNNPGPILEFNRRHGKAKINTFAMQTTAGAREFNEVAESTGGEFVIVLRNGDTIKGADYLKNPSKFSGQIN